MDWKWPLRPDHKTKSQNGGSPLPWKESFCFPYSSLISNVQESGFDLLFVSEELSSWSQFPFAKTMEMFSGTKRYQLPIWGLSVRLGLSMSWGLFLFVPDIGDLLWFHLNPWALQVHMHMVTSCAENRCDQEPPWLFIPAKLFSSLSAMFSSHTS